MKNDKTEKLVTPEFYNKGRCKKHPEGGTLFRAAFGPFLAALSYTPPISDDHLVSPPISDENLVSPHFQKYFCF